MAKTKSTTKKRTSSTKAVSKAVHKTPPAKIKKLPSSWRLLQRSLAHLGQHWRLFTGITLVYLLLSLILVKGFAIGGNLSELRQTVEEAFKAQPSRLATGLTLYGLLISNAAATSEAAAVYQSLILIVVSLVLIWALRQSHAKAPASVKQAFYKGLYPLVPFMLVLLVIGLQLIPLGLANFIAGVVFAGLAVSMLEQILWATLIFLLVLASLYFISSSVFGLYIVSLPDMQPLAALRSARELVRGRRWAVLRKLIFLPLALLVVMAVLIIPIILAATSLATPVFFGLSLAALPVAHSYLYLLYREML